MLYRRKSRALNLYLLVFIAIILSFVEISAQKRNNVVLSLNNSTICNLKNAIKSENPGLRKSGIYFAGKYAIEEASESLVDQFKKESDPLLRILIVRVIYIIGNNDFTTDILRLASNDRNRKVRRMASAINSMMQITKSLEVAELVNSNENVK